MLLGVIGAVTIKKTDFLGLWSRLRDNKSQAICDDSAFVEIGSAPIIKQGGYGVSSLNFKSKMKRWGIFLFTKFQYWSGWGSSGGGGKEKGGWFSQPDLCDTFALKINTPLLS